MWPVLVLDMLLWAYIIPLFAALFWLPFAAYHSLLSSPRPLWLSDPWEVTLRWFVAFHGLTVVDADGADTLLIPNVAAERGAILSNHRSFGDFAFDPCQAHAPVMSRYAAIAATGLSGLLGILSNRIIAIHRGVDTREAIQAKCARHPRYLFYPEGTRRANKPNAMEPDAPRAGGLKNCYESRTPAIIVITDGKERIWNEKTGRCSFRTVLYRARHAPIRPADHESFDTFFAAVEKAWIATWRRAYAMRAERERAALL